MVEQEIFAALTQSSITALCSTRVYPAALPKDPTLPAIEYKIVGGAPQSTLGGHGSLRVRLEVNCWGNTYNDAVTLRSAVVQALSGYKVPNSNTTFSYLMPQDFFDDELLQYRAVAEFYVVSNF